MHDEYLCTVFAGCCGFDPVLVSIFDQKKINIFKKINQNQSSSSPNIERTTIGILKFTEGITVRLKLDFCLNNGLMRNNTMKAKQFKKQRYQFWYR